MSNDLEDRTLERRDEWVAEEVERLFYLSDRFLGRAIIGAARAARSIRGDGFAHHRVPRELRHAAALVWDIGPEIARRLGETDIRPAEIRPQVRAVSDANLRFWTWRCFQKTTIAFLEPAADTGRHSAWKLLLNDPSDGNPLFVALDRLAPPQNAQDDICARYIAARDRIRGSGDGRAMWSPGGQGERIRLSSAQMTSVPLAPR
ncbi:hypothetical protein OIU34_18030 [Pararhizobium sp. BT-229]|uniref:hypothetical protein n=1 Tax=Pararhizobium sp. BT-229 TaxID=2986923 RepID=UPI0021F7829F|nr:hypothetical protein [Pararhizobium sp. BT-229]MCV9963778.1 hypothetical protein [Pararhizobium sp. BT-229]